MKFGCSSDLATRIGRALISASRPTRSWSPLLEKTLHELGCRDSLSPSLVARVIDPFLLSHHSLALGFFNWASQQPRFSHTSVSYISIISSLSFSRQFHAIEALLREARAHRVSLNPSIYASVIASLLSARKPMEAFFVFRQIASSAEDLGPEICNSLVAALASDGRLDCARRVLDEMSRGGVFVTTLGFGVFLWRLCSEGGVETGVVLALLDEFRGSDSEIVGSVITLLVVHGLCKASRASEALSILEELRCRHCRPDFMAYRVVAEAIRTTTVDGDFEADLVLRSKRKLGVAPRSHDYKEFILRLVSDKRVFEAKEIGEVIVSGNFPIESEVLNVLIGSVSAIDPDSAIMFSRFMIEKGQFPTLLTLNNLSSNLCRQQKTDELLEIFQLLSFRGYFEDLESYNVMVSFLCRAGKVKEAYTALREMKRKGFGPDVNSYNSLMEACCREDLIRPAKRLWDEMFAGGFSGGDLRTYKILIGKLSAVGQIEEALRLFSHMFEKGVAPDYAIYTSLIQGIFQEKKLEEAFVVLDKALKQDLSLGRNVLNMYILCLCKEGLFVAASELLCQFDCGVTGSYTHLILLKFLADSSEVSLVTEHIRWLRETSPLMMQVISDELSASLSSSSSKLESIVRKLVNETQTVEQIPKKQR